jgi:multicomponent Na+:H+ antiporter subunit C
METILAILVGILFAISIYLMLSGSLIRLILGVFVLGNATHLLIFVSGRLTRESPPLIDYGLKVAEAGIANPLPQALILTAIVISFSLFAFLLVLTYRAYQSLDTIDTDEMRIAEPKSDAPAMRGRDV